MKLQSSKYPPAPMLTDQFWAIDGYYNSTLFTYNKDDKPVDLKTDTTHSHLSLESSYDVFVWWQE